MLGTPAGKLFCMPAAAWWPLARMAAAAAAMAAKVLCMAARLALLALADVLAAVWTIAVAAAEAGCAQTSQDDDVPAVTEHAHGHSLTENLTERRAALLQNVVWLCSGPPTAVAFASVVQPAYGPSFPVTNACQAVGRPRLRFQEKSVPSRPETKDRHAQLTNMHVGQVLETSAAGMSTWTLSLKLKMLKMTVGRCEKLRVCLSSVQAASAHKILERVILQEDALRE
eukprot:351879-Chlamydomonas_euryale.AAC.12